MRIYQKPTFDFIELRQEEKIATIASCVGSCGPKAPPEAWDSPGPGM